MMTIFTPLVTACAVLLTASTAAAQVSVTLNHNYQVQGGKMIVSVAVDNGTRVVRPRFAIIHDGQQVPGSGSKAWIDFPEIARKQEFTLRAPEAEGGWWLVLADDRTLVARVPFDVVDWMTAMELERGQPPHDATTRQ